MKSRAIGMAMLLCLGVSACAGHATRRNADTIDINKVITVNQWAAKRHATVVWVNHPQKREPQHNDG